MKAFNDLADFSDEELEALLTLARRLTSNRSPPRYAAKCCRCCS